MPNDSFYQSKEWWRVRQKAIMRDHYTCTVCNKSVREKGQARVDHIESVKEYPHLALEMSNLRTLCVSCDNKRHAEKGGVPKSKVSEDGFPVDEEHEWYGS